MPPPQGAKISPRRHFLFVLILQLLQHIKQLLRHRHPNPARILDKRDTFIAYVKYNSHGFEHVPITDNARVNDIILVYCRSGRRSKNAAEKLAALGYSNVKEFGGIIDWGYETTAE